MLRVLLAAAVCVFAISESVWAWPRLPEQVASHFDASGNPNGWSAKGGFFALMGGVWLLIVGLFFVLPYWIPRIPDALINMPHKDHWLSPERRGESLAWLRDWMQETGILTLVLMASVHHLTIRANLEEGATLQGFGLWMGVYLGVLVFWLLRLLLRFKKPATA